MQVIKDMLVWASLSCRGEGRGGAMLKVPSDCTQNSPKKLDIWKPLCEINPAYMQHGEETGNGRIDL